MYQEFGKNVFKPFSYLSCIVQKHDEIGFLRKSVIPILSRY